MSLVSIASLEVKWGWQEAVRKLAVIISIDFPALRSGSIAGKRSEARVRRTYSLDIGRPCLELGGNSRECRRCAFAYSRSSNCRRFCHPFFFPGPLGSSTINIFVKHTRDVCRFIFDFFHRTGSPN
ncbi:hypothetical protein GWI33_003740 [Rhynchophorus ferrugineus]|uniref:Uncharacterized protein n=1 Tax=Rhynchophorus ferrugineus TaxID=354439 RepID=A0A834HIY9_RHYFE|nr:hypothetical protein GWI33_003740 [Rhynchophorus ferrugineus]